MDTNAFYIIHQKLPKIVLETGFRSKKVIKMECIKNKPVDILGNAGKLGKIHSY